MNKHWFGKFLDQYEARKVVLGLIFVQFFVFIFLSSVHLKDNLATVLPVVLGNLTNEKRTHEGLSVLNENELLNLAAQMKAEDMAANGYFAHTSPDGKSPWYWITLAGYEYRHAGENLAVNFKQSESVTEAWMKSPGHRANIVKGVYTEMGTGVARGMYKGKETDFVAQVYASPLIVENTSLSLDTDFQAQTPIHREIISMDTQDKGLVLGAQTSLSDESSVTFFERNILQIAVSVLLFILMLMIVNKYYPNFVTNTIVLLFVGAGIYMYIYFKPNTMEVVQTQYSIEENTLIEL